MYFLFFLVSLAAGELVQPSAEQVLENKAAFIHSVGLRLGQIAGINESSADRFKVASTMRDTRAFKLSQEELHNLFFALHAHHALSSLLNEPNRKEPLTNNRSSRNLLGVDGPLDSFSARVKHETKNLLKQCDAESVMAGKCNLADGAFYSFGISVSGGLLGFPAAIGVTRGWEVIYDVELSEFLIFKYKGGFRTPLISGKGSISALVGLKGNTRGQALSKSYSGWQTCVAVNGGPYTVGFGVEGCIASDRSLFPGGDESQWKSAPANSKPGPGSLVPHNPRPKWDGIFSLGASWSLGTTLMIPDATIASKRFTLLNTLACDSPACAVTMLSLMPAPVPGARARLMHTFMETHCKDGAKQHDACRGFRAIGKFVSEFPASQNKGAMIKAFVNGEIDAAFARFKLKFSSPELLPSTIYEVSKETHSGKRYLRLISCDFAREEISDPYFECVGKTTEVGVRSATNPNPAHFYWRHSSAEQSGFGMVLPKGGDDGCITCMLSSRRRGWFDRDDLGSFTTCESGPTPQISQVQSMTRRELGSCKVVYENFAI